MAVRRWMAVVAILILIVVWWLTAYPRGMIVAWADHARGHYEIQTYGYPVRWSGEYAQLVWERYGVKINPVAGCEVSYDLECYVDGYNSISRPRLKARLGKDIFAECAAEARASWELAHPRE